MDTRKSAFIEHILPWENRDIVLRTIYRECFRNNMFPAEPEHQIKRDSITGEDYYLYTWKVCQLPENVEINIVLDRLPPNNPAPRKFRLHSHDYFEIMYVYSGKCLTNVSGREKEVCAGDLLLFNMQAIHKVVKHDAGDVAFSIMIRRDLFQKSFMDLLKENDMITDFFIQSIYNINNRAGQIILHRNDAFECEPLVQQMIEVFYRGEPMSQSRMKALLVLLLSEITRQYRAEYEQSQAEPDGLELSEVIEYIGAHFDSITIEQLAAHFNYTSKTMARFIKKHTNLTFRELLQQIRFQHACKYLLDEKKSIDEISTLVGYLERASFDRAFKARYHITPAEYRSLNAKKC